VVWKKGNIHIMGRKDIEQAKPELAQFLKNFFFTDQQLADLMLMVEESKEDVEVVARKWMESHPDLVSKWIPQS
jgi:glycine betaine/proline transport system substrate-binding protein